jgi:Zn-dependent alcohol dehydrogenase
MFFGQSSFSRLAIVKETGVVDVTGSVTKEELKLFAPMGCGFQTGAGTVSELAKARV